MTFQPFCETFKPQKTGKWLFSVGNPQDFERKKNSRVIHFKYTCVALSIKVKTVRVKTGRYKLVLRKVYARRWKIIFIFNESIFFFGETAMKNI